jgi:hypothetical protein
MDELKWYIKKCRTQTDDPRLAAAFQHLLDYQDTVYGISPVLRQELIEILVGDMEDE